MSLVLLTSSLFGQLRSCVHALSNNNLIIYYSHMRYRDSSLYYGKSIQCTA